MLNNQTIILQGITVEEFQLIIRKEVERVTQQPVQEIDSLLNIEQLRTLIEEKTGKRPARQTIYDWVNKRQIPFNKHGKYLYFRQSGIEAWLNNGRAK